MLFHLELLLYNIKVFRIGFYLLQLHLTYIYRKYCNIYPHKQKTSENVVVSHKFLKEPDAFISFNMPLSLCFQHQASKALLDVAFLIWKHVTY